MTRLRVPRRRPRPQRARSLPRRRRRVLAEGPRPVFAPRAQRAADLRGPRGHHRAARPRAWPSHPRRAPQGRQDGDDPAGASDRSGDRPGGRRKARRATRRWPGRTADDKRRGREGGAPTDEGGRDLEADRASQRLRHSFITAALDAGVPLRDCRRRLPTPTRGRRCATTGPGSLSTGTRRTPPSPSLPAPAEVTSRRHRADPKRHGARSLGASHLRVGWRSAPSPSPRGRW